jgi:hypothetical protein
MASDSADTQEVYPEVYVGPNCYVQTAEDRVSCFSMLLIFMLMYLPAIDLLIDTFVPPVRS